MSNGASGVTARTMGDANPYSDAGEGRTVAFLTQPG